MDNLLIHPHQHVAIHSPGPLGMEDAADSTHDYTPILLGSWSGKITFPSADT
jgi:hypothetical protein